MKEFSKSAVTVRATHLVLALRSWVDDLAGRIQSANFLRPASTRAASDQAEPAPQSPPGNLREAVQGLEPLRGSRPEEGHEWPDGWP